MTALPYSIQSNVVPRRQWNANSGYCGETSLICAGLSFGQYCSQWTARALASPRPQYLANSQVLLGSGDDKTAAKKMRLKACEYPSHSEAETRDFIVWVKSNLIEGHVPIIGVFNNVVILGEDLPGDLQYDHIVPVVGIASNSPLEEKGVVRYHASDVITLSDNGLYGPVGKPARYPFLFSYEVQHFQGTRAAANQKHGPVYMLRNKPKNFGIAIEGVLDHHGHCLPVRLSCNRNHERDPRKMKPQPKQQPPPSPTLAQGPQCDQPSRPDDIRLTATVDLRKQSGAWNLYRYDDFAQVPDRDFNANAGNAAQVWQIPANSGPTYTLEHAAKSDETVVFRAVPASAP